MPELGAKQAAKLNFDPDLSDGLSCLGVVSQRHQTKPASTLPGHREPDAPLFPFVPCSHDGRFQVMSISEPTT
jgi:hypothetical protein